MTSCAFAKGDWNGMTAGRPCADLMAMMFVNKMHVYFFLLYFDFDRLPAFTFTFPGALDGILLHFYLRVRVQAAGSRQSRAPDSAFISFLHIKSIAFVY